jgi:ABC-2 type transport system ATP-binding protein
MPQASRAPVVTVSGVGKRFGDVVALDGVTFTVNSPGLLGILGPNGAGKSTLLDILEGLAAPTTGTVELFGQPIDPYPRARVGVVLQKEVQLERCSTEEYADLFASIFGVRHGKELILKRANLGARARVPMVQLSGGEAARLFIATALIHDPELLFLDEPTAPLDPESKREVGDMLREIAKERAVVLTTHDLREADALCDRLVFLVGGRIHAAGARADLIAAVPEQARGTLGVEDAFFHFCSVRMRRGDVIEVDS